MLHKFFGTDSQNTSVSLIFLLPHPLISTTCIFRLHSPLLHSTHNWRPNSSSYPIARFSSCAATRSPSPPITTVYPTLSSRLDFPGFWHGTQTKREVWRLRTWFGRAPVSKLVVSLTWLLWVIISFWRFTLYYMFSHRAWFETNVSKSKGYRMRTTTVEM